MSRVSTTTMALMASFRGEAERKHRMSRLSTLPNVPESEDRPRTRAEFDAPTPRGEAQHEIRPPRRRRTPRSPSSSTAIARSTSARSPHDVDGAFLAGDGVARARAALADGRAPRGRPTPRSLRVGAPIARPSAVYCIGMNYAAHAAESGSAPPEQHRHVHEVPEHRRRPVRRRRDPARQRRRPTGRSSSASSSAAAPATSTPPPRLARTSPGYVDGQRPLRARLAARRARAASGRRARARPASARSARGSSRPTSSTPTTCACAASSTASRARTRARADLIFGIDHDRLRAQPGTSCSSPATSSSPARPRASRSRAGSPTSPPGDVVELEIEGLGRQRQHVVSG